ncbi:MAG: sulfotransferase [Candidatus Brocadia sp.]|nr:sulfotransferase [Candidatus Brocadia sp.]
MSLSPDYFKYLNHFGKTATVREFFENAHMPDMVALRHDIDHSLDLALEMGYWEKEYGIRSTYFLLHSADYWNDSRFIEKCLQIQDFGHEVGLHLNILAEWMRDRIDNPSLHLEKLIAPLRNAGVRLSGVSSHGDRLCYKQQFINYWCFSELRPPDPVTTESGICAEGIPVKEERFQIRYPSTHRLVRENGHIFDLWSISTKKLGIDYEANHVAYDSYYTDTGGGWFRSGDPMKQTLASGRHQILMHPVYWRGPQKIYFFLSTARSGSKWLVNFLSQATPLRARHEFSLNHRFKSGNLIAEKFLPWPWFIYILNRLLKGRKLIAKKRTAKGFRDLVWKKDEAKKLLIEARAWIDEFHEDYAEANVYLERFLSIMEEVFPDATLVHLHRNPKNVIRSILNRKWYDTPEDSKHPVIEVEDWDSRNQFEKACWYVRKTNESLLHACQYRLAYERMVNDPGYLTERLRSLGIPVFPRLAELEFRKKINVNYSYEFPDYAGWTEENKASFHSICDPVNETLGYESRRGTHTQSLEVKQKDMNDDGKINSRSLPETIIEMDFRKMRYNLYSPKGCKVKNSGEGIEIFPKACKRSYVLLGGGKWYYVKEDEGWASETGHYYQGVLDLEIYQNLSIILMCLMYNKKGYLIAERPLGQIKQEATPCKFSFKVRGDAKRFNIALYISPSDLPGKAEMKKIRIKKMPL